MTQHLEGSAHVVLMLSDHKNLEYFVTAKQLHISKSIGQSTSLGSTT